MVTQSTQNLMRAAIETSPFDPAAAFIYLTRLWLAFAEITDDYLRSQYATLGRASAARAIGFSDDTLGENDRVIDFAAWRAQRLRESQSRKERGR